MANLSEHVKTRVQLCGGLVVEIEGRRLEAGIGGRQGRILFSYLVLQRARAVKREELIEALWPDRPPVSPDSALNTLVSRLRKGLGHAVICGRSELRLELPPDAVVDIESASVAIQRAEQALERSDWLDAMNAADVALTVAERGFLEEVDADWAQDERRRLEEVCLRALECLAAGGLGVGGARLSATERAARRLIKLAPYRETGYRYLMQALAERGRVAEALRVFDDARRLLQAELGTPPSAALRSLHERLLSEQRVEPQGERDDPLAVGVATTTTLFTDVVCTGDIAPEGAEQLRHAHRRLLGQAVAAHGGDAVETDAGSAAVFHSTRNGLACAIQLQQAVEHHNRRQPKRQLRVRAAVHCGPPARADEQSTSISLKLARQICALAEPGQVLASAAVRACAAPEHRFRDFGTVSSAGSAQALTVVEVAWERAVQTPLALPSAFLVRNRERFVGRGEELERLWELYEQASSGSAVVAFVRGEPGIGKTRLALELALRAHSDGAAVLYGRCDEEPLLPHQPFAQALAHYVACCPLSELAGQLGSTGGELRRLVPELTARLPQLAPPVADGADGERFRLFEAVSALLCHAGDVRPVVLVLDDLHWADRPSLLLLRHLGRHAHPASLLVLATYRDAEVGLGHPLCEMLAELSRDASFARLSLGPLDLAAVEALVSSHSGEQAPQLIERLFSETEGNPFFIVQMLRHAADCGGAHGERRQRSSGLGHDAVGIPEGVKDVIGRRIDRLGQSTRNVLALASVVGRDFELDVLEHMSGVDEDELVETLEEAARARVIEELPGAVGRYTFTHALIRETIYASLSGTRRALLHRRVAATLEGTRAADLDAYRADLAHHFAKAGSAADVAKAIDHAAAAGNSALAQLAYEQAAALYRYAAALIETVESPAGVAQRCDLVIAQGEAERGAGDPAYRVTLLEGARLAQELGHAERLARAALANNRGFFSAVAGVDRERVAVLEAALEAHGARDSAVRARLLAQLAIELFADADWRRRARLSDEALAMARRIGDPRTLARTLHHRYVALWGPRSLPERLANCHEATRLTDRLDDPLLSFQSARFGLHVATEVGDLARADRSLERARELAQQLKQPIIQWYYACIHAKRISITGSPAEVETLAREASELGYRARQPEAALWLELHLFVARLLQGSLAHDQVDPLEADRVAALDTGFGGTPSRSVPLLLEAVQIATACEIGRSDAACERFDVLMADELSDLPYDWTALAVPAAASVACGHLGDVRRARTLYAMLEPYAGQFVDGGPAWFGATSHYLANLALTLGRRDEADAHFAAATDAYTAIGAELWLSRARLDRARLLLARPHRGDTRHAEELLADVLGLAEQRGLAAVKRTAT